MNYCSPRKNDNDLSCFNKKEIDLLYKLKIADDESEDKTFKDKYEKLKNYFNDEEYNWLDKLNKSELDNFNSDIFKPKKPLNWRDDKNAWLSNFDIDNVLVQFEEKYQDFLYIQASPIDYDKKLNDRYVSDILANINLEKNS